MSKYFLESLFTMNFEFVRYCLIKWFQKLLKVFNLKTFFISRAVNFVIYQVCWVYQGEILWLCKSRLFLRVSFFSLSQFDQKRFRRKKQSVVLLLRMHNMTLMKHFQPCKKPSKLLNLSTRRIWLRSNHMDDHHLS